MVRHDQELLAASRRLLRATGERGRLSPARIRRSVSTSYYALFHFLVEECGYQLLGTGDHLRNRRRILARVFTHSGMRAAFSKVRGAQVDRSILDYLETGPNPPPAFARITANIFLQAHDLRTEADYDLTVTLEEVDAELLIARVQQAIEGWMAATSRADREFKKGFCLLLLLKGQLRKDG